MSNITTNGTATSSVPWYKEITRVQWNTLIAGFLGWGLDAFDFLLYNFTILEVIKEWGLSTAETGLVTSVTVIASAFGGFVFGIIADRIGRMKALTVTILIYSIASGFCGVAQNIWQLMAFRILVGLGMGGEWTAGAALVSEMWPKEHRGKAMSIMQAAYAVGGMVAGLIAGPIIAAHGWRVLFFLGIIPALLVLWIRRNVGESELWVEQRQKVLSHQTADKHFSELFKGKMLRITLLATLFCSALMVASLPTTVWLPTYLGMPVDKGGAGLSIVKSSWFVIPYFFGSFIGYLTFGFISDGLGRKKSFAAFFVASLIIVPLYMKVSQNEIVFAIATFLVGFFVVGFYGGFGTVLAELFPTSIRGSGQGFAYNVGRGAGAIGISFVGNIAIVIGGLGNALLLTTSIFVIALIILFMLPETAGKELE